MTDQFASIAAQMRSKSKKAKEEEPPRDFDELYRLRARILGVLIRDARQTAGETAEQCASQIGVAPDLLDAWELGRTMPSLPHLELLAYHFNLPISHFWSAETLRQTAHRPVNSEEYVLIRNRLIGGLLRSARQQQNLTVEELAEAAGLPPGNVNAYELGQRAIPTPVLMSLAHACHVSLSYFLENGNRVASFLALQEDLKQFGELPEDLRRFVSSPVNQPYLQLAMKLAQMGTDELRGIAAAILDITL